MRSILLLLILIFSFSHSFADDKIDNIPKLTINDKDTATIELRATCKRGRWVWNTKAVNKMNIDRKGINIKVNTKDHFGHDVNTYISIDWKQIKEMMRIMLRDEFGIDIIQFKEKIKSMKGNTDD